MGHQHQGVRCHYLSDSATLNLVEGEADRHAPVIQAAGVGEDIAERRDGSVRVAVLDV